MAGGGMDKAMDAMDTSKFYPIITLLLAAIALAETVFIPGGFLAGAGTIYILLPLKFFISEYIFPNTPAGKMLGAGKKTGEEDGDEEEGASPAIGKQANQAAAVAGKGAKAALGKAGWLAVVDYFITPMKNFEKAILMFSSILYVIAFAAHVALLAYAAYTVCDSIPGVPSSWCEALIDYFVK